jgi:hypothetical protein
MFLLSSIQKINMDDIYCLIHATNNPDCISWDELKAGHFNTNHQFPGVYMSMITKDNIENVNIYPGKYLMIFSKILLCQNNYHINARDYNGIITEKNTYYPWSLPEFLANNNNTIMNEIIFHDNIDIKYCCRIITKTSLISTSLLKEQEQSLRNTQLEPDMSKLPFFCYPFEDIYTGINPLPPCSYAWYIMMSKMADIADGEGGREGGREGGKSIREKIREKAKYLYMNRDKQKIMYLKKFSQESLGCKN